MKKGFTLVEILIALAGISVLAIVATSFLFTILSQRDQGMAESLAAEQAEAVFSMMGTAVRSAKKIVIEEGGAGLGLAGRDECWLFRLNEESSQIMFGRSEGTSCSIPTSAGQALTTSKAGVDRVSFSLLAPDDSSRTVMMEMDLTVYRPLWNTSQEFSQTFVNVVDEMIEEEE